MTCSKGDSLPWTVGVQPCIATVEISVAVPEKMGINLPQEQAIPLSGTLARYTPSDHKVTCLIMFVTTFFIIAPN